MSDGIKLADIAGHFASAVEGTVQQPNIDAAPTVSQGLDLNM